jgi:hypothetical protein
MKHILLILLIICNYCASFEVLCLKSKILNSLDIYIASKGIAIKLLDTINLKQLKENKLNNIYGTIECKLNKIGYSINKGCKHAETNLYSTSSEYENEEKRFFCIKLIENLSNYQIMESKRRLEINCDTSFNYNNKIALYFFSIQQPQLLYNINSLGHHLNPSVIQFNNRLLMFSMIKWGKEYEYIRFAVLNNTKNDNKDDYTNIEVKDKDINSLKYKGNVLRGHDPRVIQLNETHMLMMYSYNDNINQNLPNSLSPHRVYVAILTMDIINNNNVYIRVKTFPPVIQKLQLLTNTFLTEKRSQKNWSPFKYKDSIYFVKSINPLHVVDIVYNNVAQPYSTTISYQEHIDLPDYFDHLRGGTNALFIKNSNYYISFYHSIMTDPTTTVRSYVMGAYTFYMDEDKDFKLRNISKFPIIDNRFYSGRPAWEISTSKNKFIINLTIQKKKMDYIFFPMSIFYNDAESIINLSFGYQDHESFLVQLNVEDLIKSLIPLNSISHI